MSETTVRHVQRPTAALPVLHLERSIPVRARWDLTIDGAVEAPARISLDRLGTMQLDERVWDLHCVWGWSKPACRWRGVPAGILLDEARPLACVNYGVALAAGDQYASCLSIDDLRASLIALELDGKALTCEHGGPMRLVTPPNKWGYKGVKWVTRISLVEQFTPGVWETLVGNPHGDVPAERLELKEE